MMNITRRRARSRWLTFALMAAPLLGSAAAAFEPASLPPAANATFDDRQDVASVSVPVAVYGQDNAVKQVEGALRRRVWLMASPTLPTLRIVQGLRSDLDAAGYEVLLDCAAEACGGFDFRFGLPVLPAPVMNVDLFDFRVLTASKRVGGQVEYVYLLVSRGRSNRYVQLFEVVTGGRLKPAPVASSEASSDTGDAPTLTPAPAVPASANTLIARLTAAGHVVLPDLDFATGADALSDRDYPSLAALAAYLAQNPGSRVVLVGHTDSVGSLENNTALSRRRAESVRQRLIGDYNIPEAQLTAQGAGYLAPIRSNQSEEGREANRRVEAVLLSVE